MGYAYYTLPDGREAGYGVSALCDVKRCKHEINRGMGYLCGEYPDGHRDPDEPGCGKYFCGDHEFKHDCPKEECGVYPSEEEETREPCYALKGHEGPHKDPDGLSFTKTEEDDE